MQPSEVLIAAKALFGKHGQRWTRGIEHRRGLTGDNYCSIGAINAVPSNSRYDTYKAAEYLRASIRIETGGKQSRIEDFNDMGSAASIIQNGERSLLIRMPLALASFIPGVRAIRWFKIKRVWCRAIKLAVEDELQQEEACSRTSSF